MELGLEEHANHAIPPPTGTQRLPDPGPAMPPGLRDLGSGAPGF
jgi:hypothetical protein